MPTVMGRKAVNFAQKGEIGLLEIRNWEFSFAQIGIGDRTLTANVDAIQMECGFKVSGWDSSDPNCALCRN